MRKSIVFFVGLAFVCLLVLGTTGIGYAEKKWSIKDIPEIKNKQTIHVAFFGGPRNIEKCTDDKLEKFAKHVRQAEHGINSGNRWI